MHLPLLFLSAVLVQSASPIPVEEFSKLYESGIAKARDVYNHLTIHEEYLVESVKRRDVNEGSVCGDYCKSLMIQNNRKYLTVLCPRHQFTLHEEGTSGWSSPGFFPLNVKPDAYESIKSSMMRNFPHAFRLPFTTYGHAMSVSDLLKGKSFVGRPDSSKTVVDQITVIRNNNLIAFRIQFNCLDSNNASFLKGHLDISPSTSYFITRGRINKEEWEIEYGELINEVPVIKKVVVRNDNRPSDVLVLNVLKASAYDTVNENEYELRHYGITEPVHDSSFDPLQDTGVLLALCIALGSVACLIVAALVIALKKGWSPSLPLQKEC